MEYMLWKLDSEYNGVCFCLHKQVIRHNYRLFNQSKVVVHVIQYVEFENLSLFKILKLFVIPLVDVAGCQSPGGFENCSSG